MNLKITIKWNPPAACWVADLADVNGTLIVGGIPLVTGANLLEQFNYLGFKGQFIAQTDHDPDAVPTYADLGSTGHFYFVQP